MSVLSRSALAAASSSGRCALRSTCSAKRGMMSASAAPITRRLPKEEGSIADIFTSLTDEEHNVLPERFSNLKKEMWKDSLVESWREVLKELETTVEEVATRGSDMVPRISYSDIQKGLSKDQIDEIRKTGTVIVTGAIPQDEALAWKQSIRDYALANADRVKGFPPENIQVFELYNTKAQTLARTHPGLINTHKFLLSLWHTSDPNTPISLRTPISYYDRLRIRQPGDAKFTLGPHIDGGALERWEDPGFRGVFGKILEGGGNWRQHDPYDASKRIGIIQDLYNASNQCSIFRPWQGWTSLSSTGPGEGTLKVLPMLNLASAYLILRPFFHPTAGTSLAFNDWKLDLESTAFPGSSPRKTQELNELTHPHLHLGRTMASIPRVEPGDQVYWHCDGVHAVEGHHGGKGDSSVLYIPAVPLTQHNAVYLRDQRDNFLAGLPAPDFPGGEGESKFVGRATLDDIKTPEGRKMLGFVPFDPATDGPNTAFVEEVNRTLGL